MESLYRRAVVALAVLAGAIIALIALAIPVDVFLRACCTRAIFGLTDLIEHGLAAATFMGAPWVLMKNAHVSVDIVVTQLPDRVRRRLEILVNGLGAAASATFFWYILQAALIAFARGSMVRGIVVIPEWLTFLAPALCTLLLAAGFLLRAAHSPGRASAAGL